MTELFLNLNIVDQVIVITVIASLIGFIFPLYSRAVLGLIPRQALTPFGFHRNFTHGFFHLNWLHLLINCLGLFTFGHAVRYLVGSDQRFLQIFLISLILGGLLYSALFFFRQALVIGISGAVSGLVFASLLLNPHLKVTFLGIPLPSHWFMISFLTISLLLELIARGRVAHGLHATGAVAGVIAAYYVRPELVTSNAKTIFAPSAHLVEAFNQMLVSML